VPASVQGVPVQFSVLNVVAVALLMVVTEVVLMLVDVDAPPFPGDNPSTSTLPPQASRVSVVASAKVRTIRVRWRLVAESEVWFLSMAKGGTEGSPRTQAHTRPSTPVGRVLAEEVRGSKIPSRWLAVDARAVFTPPPARFVSLAVPVVVAWAGGYARCGVRRSWRISAPEPKPTTSRSARAHR
jgi:hypothetical protein